MSITPPELTDSLPQSLKDLLELYWQDWSESCESAGIDPLSIPLSRVGKVWACSEFVARLCIRKPALLIELLGQKLELSLSLSDYKSHVLTAIAEAGDSDDDLMQALRVLRQKEMLRIAWCDLERLVALDQTLHELSDFAEAMVSATLEHLHEKAVEIMGVPMSEEGEPQTMLVLAMGKLGGRELNFSSDIDLIFTYAEEGNTEGGRRLTNHEFFIRQAQKFIKILNKTTQEGFVFRVDTRLRPYGESGPLVLGFVAMEQYYQLQGRDWERYAMIKARTITGKQQDRKQLEAMLRPFVYRRYLDYSAFESIREMKLMIESEVKRKGFQDNIKLGRGGIREIEFIGQTFQLLRGGHDVKLQTRGIMDVLSLLGEMNLLEADEVERLQQAYHFHRRLENRIQMERDMQLHNLPVDDISRQKLSLAMGCDTWDELNRIVEQYRENVHEIFQSIVSHDSESEHDDDNVHGLREYWSDSSDNNDLSQWFEGGDFENPSEVLKIFDAFKSGMNIRTLSEGASQKLLKLLFKLLVEIAKYSEASVLFERVLEILNAIVGRQVYIKLLLECPQARAQMLSLCSVSSWFVKQLASNPILLDGLLDADELYQSKDHQALREELNYLLSSVDEGDLEQYMDRLRQFKNVQVMKAAVLDVSGVLAVTDVGETLSNIAEVILVKVLDLAWDEMCDKYGSPVCSVDGKECYPEIAVVAYGKLGGVELGYGSDLDIVFLHNSSGDRQQTSGEKSIDNTMFFNRVTQRVLHILGTRMYSGVLYETDIRLRPEGRSGLMVSSLNAFEQYQQEKAWTWEHQALIRARIVAGNDHLRQEFDRIRESVLVVEREPAELCRDVVEMREKMRTHLASPHMKSRDNVFDIKQDKGGIVDIEFLVQAGALLCAKKRPDVMNSTSMLVFLERLADCDWLDADECRDLGNAYRDFRQQVNAQALLVENAEEFSEEQLAHRQRVTDIWNRHMPGRESGQ
jgi:glutamate-ammonia-ligase adenylyltransferase